ncbi:DMT family transporter [Pelagibius marinus]|uniref:DMT family transporter n=1 Tax=Pelagibius marinus TaxID=2762760 RepID=UPI0029C9B2B3|nr:DMT family transporter [Pelagibius marinus]
MMRRSLSTTISQNPWWVVWVPWVFVVLWSGGFAFAKIGLLYAAPLTFLALRYVVLVALLGAIYIVLRPPLPSSARQWWDQIVVGFCIQAVYFVLTYFAFILGVSAGAFGVIISFQPILVALSVGRFADENVSAGRWLGIVCGLAGAVIVIVATSDFDSTSLLGVLASIGALAGMTTGTLYEKRFGSAQHPVSANLIQYAVALIVCAPFALLLEDIRIEWNTEFIVALGYLVIANSLISLTLLLAMIRQGEVSRVSSLFFLVPPTAALFAWALIGETMPPAAWLGMVAAVFGVALAGGMQWRGKASADSKAAR